MASCNNWRRASFVLLFLLLLTVDLIFASKGDEDEEDPYTTSDPKKREPSPCEICKFFITELQQRLDLSAKSKEIIETGHGLEKKKRFKYLTSELRLTEALHEPHICENILQYNVHAERKGSLRYAKGMSETMQTLHGLVNKGVKVELGIPYELWDKPSAEVSKMHRACFTFAEKYEEAIEDWYYNRQGTESLINFICAEQFLKDKDQSCLKEVFELKGDTGDENDDDDHTQRKKQAKKKLKKKKSDEVTPPPASGEEPGMIPTTTADTTTTLDMDKDEL